MTRKRLAFIVRRSIFVIFLAGLFLLPSAVNGTNDSPEITPPSRSTTSITKNDESGLDFELFVAEAELGAEGEISVPGLDSTIMKPGAPALPFFSTYIAVPPQASYKISIKEMKSFERNGVSISPVPTYHLDPGQESLNSVASDGSGVVIESDPSYIPDPVIYEDDSFFPDDGYVVGEETIADGMRLIKLQIYPLRYNALDATLEQVSHIVVEVDFSNAILSEEPGSSESELNTNPFWRERVMNYPPSSWRTQEQMTTEAVDALNLPFGVTTHKIELNQDGIYSIKGSQLGIKAGDKIEPSSVQMMHRGQPVAYQFVNNDADPKFGPNDEIRFYGWKFDGSRYEDMFVSNNVFWLWFAGSGEQIKTEANATGKGYAQVKTFNESITKWPHNSYFLGWRINWDEADNEATTWYWKNYFIDKDEVEKANLDIELPDPVVESGKDGTILVEFSTAYGSGGGGPVQYNAEVSLNNETNSTTGTWKNGDNVNVVHKAPLSKFIDSKNNIRLELSVDKNEESTYGDILVTRATVDYLRKLIAIDDQLIFNGGTKGKHEFLVSGFSKSIDSSKAMVWDISNRNKPVAININAADVKSGSADKTLNIGRDHQDKARFIASTTANLLKVDNISQFVPKQLTPPNGVGTWVAITHKSFLPAAQKLAEHRGKGTGDTPWNPYMSTVILDVENIINQVGYGFNTPTAIQDFLRYAYSNWQGPPQYVTLIGDATINPRQLKCDNCHVKWDPSRRTFVPTDLLFVDRTIGMIPSDFTYSLLAGDDLISELAVARIPSETLAEANAVVQKIITYENRFLSSKPQDAPWLSMPYLFVADDLDTGGNFCAESMEAAKHTASTIEKHFLCLPSEKEREDMGITIVKATNDLKLEMFRLINGHYKDIPPLSMLNYRGHGGVTRWAKPSIMDLSLLDSWQNYDPLVILSADCLDGHFATTEGSGLGESILTMANTGSAAHWASVGYGYTFEHSHLHNRFYDAVFSAGQTTMGDAVNFAKASYVDAGFPVAEAYGFTLLGDAAMAVSPWYPTINVPVVMSPR